MATKGLAYLLGLGSATAAASSLVSGSVSIAKYIDNIHSIRDAIYSKAPAITPEVIQQANKVISDISLIDFGLGMVQVAFSGFLAASSYYFLRRASNP